MCLVTRHRRTDRQTHTHLVVSSFWANSDGRIDHLAPLWTTGWTAATTTTGTTWTRWWTGCSLLTPVSITIKHTLHWVNCALKTTKRPSRSFDYHSDKKHFHTHVRIHAHTCKCLLYNTHYCLYVYQCSRTHKLKVSHAQAQKQYNIFSNCLIKWSSLIEALAQFKKRDEHWKAIFK